MSHDIILINAQHAFLINAHLINARHAVLINAQRAIFSLIL